MLCKQYYFIAVSKKKTDTGLFIINESNKTKSWARTIIKNQELKTAGVSMEGRVQSSGGMGQTGAGPGWWFLGLMSSSVTCEARSQPEESHPSLGSPVPATSCHHPVFAEAGEVQQWVRHAAVGRGRVRAAVFRGSL